ncbi:MAG: transglutaminase domain-containing protein [Pseudomonadota bacterium]
MWLHASCSLSFEAAFPTPMIFMLRPRSRPGQWVGSEEYRLTPTIRVSEFTDGFGNLAQRLIAPPGDFRVQASARVMVEAPPAPPLHAPFVEVASLPDEALVYLLPSRYCEADRLGNRAHEIVGDAAPGYAQVTRIVDWVMSAIRYTPGSSTSPVSALEVIERGEGVCRDLTHVTIALCRALCIPARMVVGYVRELDPMDVHAWLEVYVGHAWHVFDPLGARARGPRIVIGHGRDATDVALYNQYGPLLLPYDMKVAVSELPAGP